MSSLALYLRKKSGIREAPWILLIPLLFIAALIGVYQFRPESIIFVAGAGVAFILTYGWRTDVWAGLVLTYIGMSTSYNYGADYELTLVPYFQQFGIVFTILLFFLAYVNKYVVSNSVTSLEKTYKPKSDFVGVIIGIMMVYLVFELLMGIVQNHDEYFISTTACFLVLYLIYFIWRSIIKTNESAAKWLKFFVWVAVLTGFSYIYMALSFWQNPIELIMYRSITRQAHFGLTAIPFAIAFLILAKTRWQRALYIFATLGLYMFILASQIRALWLTTAALTFIMFVLYAFRNGNTKKAWIIVGSGVLAVTLFFLIVLYAIMLSLDIDTTVIFKRWEDVSSGKDISLAMRVSDAENYWAWIKQSPWIGHGFGKEVFSVPLGKQYMFMDNSYVTVLLIGGFPLGIMLVLLYVISIFRSIIVYLKARKLEDRVLASAVFASIAGTMIAAMTCSSLLIYRFIYVYVLLMAIAYRMWFTYRERKREVVNEG